MRISSARGKSVRVGALLAVRLPYLTVNPSVRICTVRPLPGASMTLPSPMYLATWLTGWWEKTRSPGISSERDIGASALCMCRELRGSVTPLAWRHE